MLIGKGIPSHKIYDFSDYYFLTELPTQYFDDELIALEDEEVFIDGGSFDFCTSEIFINRMKESNLNYKRIYAFEPDKKNFEGCKRKTHGMENVLITQAGLWSSDTSIPFLAQGNGASRFKANEIGGNSVRAVSLDSYITEKVSFIKMDIEGSELEALNGAKNLLMRDKPKLAICVYHKKEDLWEIPFFVKTLVPEYKIYMRHYSNYANETVMYAICEKIIKDKGK